MSFSIDGPLVIITPNCVHAEVDNTPHFRGIGAFLVELNQVSRRLNSPASYFQARVGCIQNFQLDLNHAW